MSYAGPIRVMCLLALLCAGSAIPQAGWAHSEGIEAADPSTPVALLGLQSATIRYVPPNTEFLQWRELFDSVVDSAIDSETDSMTHGAHHAPEADANMHLGHNPATAQQSTQK